MLILWREGQLETVIDDRTLLLKFKSINLQKCHELISRKQMFRLPLQDKNILATVYKSYVLQARKIQRH